MIGATLFRVLLLATGLAAVETAIGDVLAGSLYAWVVLMAGLALVIGGTAGFMVPLLGGRQGEEVPDDP